MKKLVRMECVKAFRNKYFWFSLMLGMLFSVMSILYSVGSFELAKENFIFSGNPMTGNIGLYNSWLGGESSSLGETLFFTLLPLLAILPYGWSFCHERNQGYLKYIAVRCNKRKYFLAKYIASFLSGGVVIIIPLVFSFIVTACFIPAYCPQIIYAPYYSVVHGSLWSEIFFNDPLIFVVLYLIIDFIFGGFFATFGYAAGLFIKNRFAAMIVPYLLVMGLHYCRTFLTYKVYVEISPINFLHTTCIQNVANSWVIIFEGIIFFLIPFCLIMREGAKGEIL